MPIIVLHRTETNTNWLYRHELDKTSSSKIIMFRSEKSQKLWKLQSGPYIVTKENTEVFYKISLEADPTMNQVVHQNQFVRYFLMKKFCRTF